MIIYQQSTILFFVLIVILIPVTIGLIKFLKSAGKESIIRKQIRKNQFEIDTLESKSLIETFKTYCSYILNKTTISVDPYEQIIEILSERAKLELLYYDYKFKIDSYKLENNDYVSTLDRINRETDQFLCRKKDVLDQMNGKQPYIHPLLD